MKRILSLLVILFMAHFAHAQIVINEIFYRPGTAFPENTGLEFIELHNPTNTAVEIGGWAITSGTSYTFPANTTLPAGGYLVVAANPTLVQNSYGISGVLGPWASGSTLANGGEKLALSKPGAAPGPFETIDSVRYADEGDWATRVRETTFNGWVWITPANGGNASMELRNPAISNDNGQNWAPSIAASGATPGAANSRLTNNVAPIIEKVKHSPAVPKSSDSVTISCVVTDESAVQFLNASLFWRDASGTSPGTFQELPMSGDATGRFTALLSPKANLTIIEYYVSVSDGVNTRTWPAATGEGQTANAQYLVTNEVLSPSAAYYFLVLTGSENAAYASAASQDGPQNKIDRQFNTTLITSNGADTSIRHRSTIRFRGNSSRSYQFKPLRVSIAGDDPLDDVTSFNLNPRASYLQFFGMRALQLGGIRAPDSIPVKPRRNGIESTTNNGNTPDYGFWVREEDVSGDFVSNHFPAAKGGNVYKKVDNGGALNYYWRSGQAAPANPNSTLDGWSKQNNSSANSWSDLTSFFQTWQAAAAPHFPGAPANDVAESNGTRITGIGKWNGTPFTNAEMTNLENVSDFNQWARWFAIMTILQDYETNISNGVDDDYAVYFAPGLDGRRRMNLITHDMDTILGLGDTAQPATATGLYDMTSEGQGGGQAFRTLLPLFGTAATPGNAAFRQKYLDAIRELFGTVFNADTTTDPNPAFHQFIDSHLTGWAPAARITAIKNFMTTRQNHLLGLIGAGPITPPPATSSPNVTSIPGPLMIHEVLAHNTSTLLNGTSYPDLIELHNASNATIVLAGKSLSDDPLAKTKYVFPAGATIPAGGYLLVFADSDTTSPGLHTGFALDRQGDAVYLYDSVADGQALLDSIVFGLQAPDLSLGRVGATRDTWTLCVPSPGTGNQAVQAFGPPGGLRINEWAGNRDYLLDADFLEIYNPAQSPVALGGMTLTDDFINYPARSVIPPLSFIAPGGILAFTAKGNGVTEGNASELPFNIDANFGFLALLGQNGTIVDRVDVVAQPDDTSRGRTPDGAAAIATFGLPGNLPTPGAPNVAPPASVLALMNQLRISELLYAPNNLEYVELHNVGSTVLDLSGVRFTSGISYIFDAGTTLAPGAFLAVCRDRTAFTAQFGSSVPLAPRIFGGSLDNAGETVALQPPAPWDVNILKFAYDPGWYSPDTTNGFALTVTDDARTPARDWDERSTWSPSPVLYGTPGAESPPSVTSALNVTGFVNRAFSYQIDATKNPTSYNATPLPSGLTINTATGVISGTATATSTTSVTISATNSSGTTTRTLTLNIALPPPPVMGGPDSASGLIGNAFSYQIIASNSPNSYGAMDLPPGLSVNVETGLIGGTPSEGGVFSATISATNASGTASKPLSITIAMPSAPVINNASTANAVVGDAFNLQISATNSPNSYGATGLPANLSVNSATGLISGTATTAGSYNVTLSASNSGGTGTKALTLNVTTSGSLASFVWGPIAGPQQAGTPFAATVRGVDAQGRTVTTFSGNIGASGEASGAGGPIIVITECGAGTVDYFEIQNAGTTAVNTSGWFVIPNNANNGQNAYHTPWPLPASIAPGEVVTVSENTPGIYPVTINWGTGFGAGANGWCMLCDNTGAVRDFVAWGYSSANISAISLTNVSNGGPTYPPITVSSAQWTGNGASTFFSSVRNRVGSADTNTSNDWRSGNSEADKGLPNPDMQLPFVAPAVAVTVAPTVLSVVGGVWSGNITVSQAGNNVTLLASPGTSFVGRSNAFNVVVPPAPVVTSPAAAIGVVGGPFSYRILGTNSPTSYAATNLPSGVTISTTTGLISGTPTVAGSRTVNVSATNLGGTGTLALVLDIQSDADADKMGDAWEAAHGLNNTVNDAAEDLDGDGRNNLTEWLAGTAPNNPGSRLEVTGWERAGNNVVMTWSAVVGKRYRVATRPDVSVGAWSDLTPTPVVATGSSLSFTHVGGGSAEQRFYRVMVEP